MSHPNARPAVDVTARTNVGWSRQRTYVDPWRAPPSQRLKRNRHVYPLSWRAEAKSRGTSHRDAQLASSIIHGGSPACTLWRTEPGKVQLRKKKMEEIWNAGSLDFLNLPLETREPREFCYSYWEDICFSYTSQRWECQFSLVHCFVVGIVTFVCQMSKILR